MTQFIFNGILIGSIYALIALGFGLIYKGLKFFHFSHGAIYTVGAYLAFTFYFYIRINLIYSFFLPQYLQV